MTDRPILFSGAMVRAIIEGRKTQTRRVIDFDGADKVFTFAKVATDDQGRGVYEIQDAGGNAGARPAGDHIVDHHFSPRIAVGDRLWVREAWRVMKPLDDISPRDITPHAPITYEADGAPFDGRKRASMHMPRWASRLTLTVTDVRIERLRSIREADAIAEGCPARDAEDLAGMSAHGWFQDLWTSINGADSWAADPWVTAYTFTVDRANIDAAAA